MSRPKIKIETDTSDRITEVLSIISLVILVIVVAFYYSGLPDSVPVHYDLKGVPDRYGNKSTLLILPAVGIILYLGLTIITRFPHAFNYPVKITTDNARKQYTIAIRMLRIVKFMVIVMFTIITYTSIKTAIGEYNGLGAWLIPLFMVAITLVIGYYLLMAIKSK